MLILALAIVLAPLAWLLVKRTQHADPATRARQWRWLGACLGTALALRVALVAPLALRIAICVFAVAAFAVWLRRRGQGGDGPGGGGHDEPVDPGPDPSPDHVVDRPLERLDPVAFDRARAGWEHDVKKPTAD